MLRAAGCDDGPVPDGPQVQTGLRQRAHRQSGAEHYGLQVLGK